MTKVKTPDTPSPMLLGLSNVKEPAYDFVFMTATFSETNQFDTVEDVDNEFLRSLRQTVSDRDKLDPREIEKINRERLQKSGVSSHQEFMREEGKKLTENLKRIVENK